MGVRKVRIANLLPETVEPALRYAMSKFGDIKSIWEELWPKFYRYKVSNGVRIVNIGLKKHMPSNLSIAGNSVMVSYERQPSTCYGCNESGHHLRDCPRRKTTVNPPATINSVTWANVVTRGGGHTHPEMVTSASTDERSVDCEMPIPQASEDNKLEERDLPSLQNPTQHTTDAPEHYEGQHNTDMGGYGRSGNGYSYRDR